MIVVWLKGQLHKSGFCGVREVAQIYVEIMETWYMNCLPPCRAAKCNFLTWIKSFLTKENCNHFTNYMDTEFYSFANLDSAKLCALPNLTPNQLKKRYADTKLWDPWLFTTLPPFATNVCSHKTQSSYIEGEKLHFYKKLVAIWWGTHRNGKFVSSNTARYSTNWMFEQRKLDLYNICKCLAWSWLLLRDMFQY